MMSRSLSVESDRRSLPHDPTILFLDKLHEQG